MSKNSETSPSFYKILITRDFTSQLRLPPQFVKNYGDNISEKAKFFTDDQSAKSWIVKTEQIGDHLFFTDGWSRFAHDVDLKYREFLVFNLIGKSKFEVSIYETNACLKDLIENESESETDQTDESDGAKIWKFAKKLAKRHSSELKIPREFAIGTGIAKQNRRKLKLRIGKGKKWPVHVSAKKCGAFAMATGWNEFLRENKVVVGSTLLFEFVGGSTNSSNVLAARVVKKGSNGKLFRSAKRKCGRPPKLEGF